jgi:hypothetical protein
MNTPKFFVWKRSFPGGMEREKRIWFALAMKTRNHFFPAFRPPRPKPCRKRREASRVKPFGPLRALAPPRRFRRVPIAGGGRGCSAGGLEQGYTQNFQRLKTKKKAVHDTEHSINRLSPSAASACDYPHQQKRLVGRVQNRAFPQAHQARPAHNGMESGGRCRPRVAVERRGEAINAVRAVCFAFLRR